MGPELGCPDGHSAASRLRSGFRCLAKSRLSQRLPRLAAPFFDARAEGFLAESCQRPAVVWVVLRTSPEVSKCPTSCHRGAVDERRRD